MMRSRTTLYPGLIGFLLLVSACTQAPGPIVDPQKPPLESATLTTELSTTGVPVAKLAEASYFRRLHINEAGQFAGQYSEGGNVRAFFYDLEDPGIVDLGPIVGGERSWAVDINEAGQVLVRTYTDRYPCPPLFSSFVWDSTTSNVTKLPPLKAQRCGTEFIEGSVNGFAINDLGQATGESVGRGFFFDLATGEMTDIGTLAADNSGGAIGWDINNDGVIAGTDLSGVSNAIIWSRTGGMRALGEIPGGRGDSRAQFINDAGEVAGTAPLADGRPRVFYWSEGTGIRDIGDLGRGSATLIQRSFTGPYLSSGGQIIGRSLISDGVATGFFWSLETGMVEIDTLGGRFSLPISINGNGRVTGSSQLPTGGHAFLWDPATRVMNDLGTLQDGGIGEGRAINEAGIVVGVVREGFSAHLVAWFTESGETDTTPPTITASVDGTLGDNGWYTSDVTVAWTVSDPESNISSTDGCDPTLIQSDTAGTTLTCSATSDGGTATRYVTIQRDATPPTVFVTGVTNGATYIEGSVPAAGCDTSDPLSGVAVPARLDIAEGHDDLVTATCAGAEDHAGNTASVSVSYTVITPEQATEDLIGSVQELVDMGVLKTGQGNGLIRPLDNAIRSLQGDRPNDACNQLADFIAEVNMKTPTPLPTEDADVLIADAAAIRSALGCRP